jgi:hypothetical protein
MAFDYHITTHDYYNLMIIPLVAISLAPVTDAFIARADSLRVGRGPRVVLSALVVLIVAVQIWNSYVTLNREDWRPDAIYWYAMGEKIGHDSGPVLTIAQDYGYRLAYWGWQEVDPWLTAGDISLRELDGRTIDTSQRFEARVAGKKFIVITQLNVFAEQKDIATYLAQHFPIFARGSSYLIYDLAHPK